MITFRDYIEDMLRPEYRAACECQLVSDPLPCPLGGTYHVSGQGMGVGLARYLALQNAKSFDDAPPTKAEVLKFFDDVKLSLLNEIIKE